MGRRVVAWVEGVPAHADELEAFAASLVGTPAAQRVGFEGLPPRLGAHAAAGGLPGHADRHRSEAMSAWATRAFLAERLAGAARRRLGLAEGAGLDEWVDALVANGDVVLAVPGDDEVAACARANAGRYREPEARLVSHVLVATRPEAEALAASAVTPGQLAELAGHCSLDTGSRHSGGDLGWVRRGELSGPLEEAVFSIAVGGVTGPVCSVFGWHVLAVRGEKQGGLPPEEERLRRARAELAQEARRVAWQQWWDRAWAAGARVPPEAAAALSPVLPGTTHRH